MNQAGTSEMTHPQAVLRQHSQALLTHLASLSDAQPHLYLHETKWLLRELGDILSPHLKEEEQKLFEDINEQTTVLWDRLKLERARRGLMHLQELISHLTVRDKEPVMHPTGMPDSVEREQGP